jgi:Tfp pilus assembly protein PilV
MMRRTLNRQRAPRNGEAGFTLLEVVVALSILIIGIIAIMQLFPQSLLQARVAAERTVTAELANSVLGQIRASSAEALYQNKIPDTFLSVYNMYGLYSGYNTTVERLNGASDVFLQRVTFTVTFPDGRVESFVTYVAQQ